MYVHSTEECISLYRVSLVNSMYHDRHRQHSVVSPGGRHHISTSTEEMRWDGYVSDWTVRLSRRVTGEMGVSWHLQYFGYQGVWLGGWESRDISSTTALIFRPLQSRTVLTTLKYLEISGNSLILENSRKSRGNVNFLREIKWWYQKWCSIVCCLSTSLKATLPSLGH